MWIQLTEPDNTNEKALSHICKGDVAIEFISKTSTHLVRSIKRRSKNVEKKSDKNLVLKKLDYFCI